MGNCCSCFSSTKEATNVRIIPMGEKRSEWEGWVEAKKPALRPGGKPSTESNYGAQKLEIIVRTNRKEQNAANYRVGADLNDSNVVVALKADTPAGRSDLRVMDQLVAVDGVELKGRKVADVIERRALHNFLVLRSGGGPQ